MNHCWSVFEVPVSGWTCISRIVHQSEHRALATRATLCRNCPPDCRSGASVITLCFCFGFESSTRVCDDPWAVEEAVICLWGKHSRAPNPISTERLRRLTCSGQGAGLRFLPLFLSFNHIRLLILSWTSLRPFLTFYEEQADVRAEQNLANCCTFKGEFCLTFSSPLKKIKHPYLIRV